MAANFINRYQNTIQGNVVQIGNTLGLSKASGSLTPGTLGSIGAFISTNVANQAPGGWPIGTTLNYTQNSSSAILTIPSGVTVVHAELVWSASYSVSGASLTSTQIASAINFTDSLGTMHSISPTAVALSGIALSEGTENSLNYVNSANVTSIISASASGTYTCGNVPCTMSASSDYLQYAGWSLFVIYSSQSLPVRNIILYVGQTTSIDVPYAVPISYPGPSYPIRMLYTAGEGDAITTGDVFNVRPGTGTQFFNLGTNAQPASSNPFSSQITNENGNLDTSGTFGTLNANATSATNMSGGRQGWDIGNNVNLLPAFIGGAVSSLNLDIGSNNDPAILLANAFIVDLSQPSATITKSVSSISAHAGDILTYTLVYNFSTVPMSTVVNIMDTIPTGLTYNSGSVIVNGINQPSYNPNPPGINLGTITTSQTFTISFKATVNKTLIPQSIPNNSYGYYTFTSGGSSFTNPVISNTVITSVDPFSAISTKSVDKLYAGIGNTLNYTITIANNGATISNIIFTDTISSYANFVASSVYVNGVNQPSYNPNPPSGFIINQITPSSIATITFQAIVATIPPTNAIINSATMTVNYTSDPSILNGAIGFINTNTVTTTIVTAILSSSKIVNESFGNIGDILVYTIPIKNTGNTTAINLTFVDTIPDGTNFVSGSLTQNGLTISGTPSPPGINIGNIGIGQTETISFKVTVYTLPSTNPISNIASTIFTYTINSLTLPNISAIGSSVTNTVTTQINTASLSRITKSVDLSFADCGSILTYTISIPNTGNVTAQNIIFKDTIPNGTVFIPNSVYINGVQMLSYDPSIGITIPNISSNSIATLSFNVQVTC